jgi:hypothetical protein
MSNKEQTAVEWFNDEILIHLNFDQRLYLKNIFEQAKEMFEQQIEDAFESGVYDGGENVSQYNMNSEQYYNETFNKD